MVRESQIVAEILLRKPSSEEWNAAIIDDNVLQKPSVSTAKRNAATIKKRIESLGSEFLEKLSFCNTEEASQLMFAATLINSMLLTDFMRHVVIDARRMYRESLDVDDWQHFWQERARIIPALNNLSESSTYKISQVAFKTLADAGYIDSTKNKRLLNVYLSQDVRNILHDLHREDIVRAMEP